MPPGAAGNLLTARSAAEGLAVELGTQRGVDVPELSLAANFTADDFQDGKLVVTGPHFLYGYVPSSDGGLAALRIHNRRMGVWARREFALEREIEAARKAAEAAELTDAFVEVDERVMLPDTDGDGIPDFEDEPEIQPERPDFLGVALERGDNTLDLVAVDEYGNVSWATLIVSTTYAPPAAEE